MHCLAATLAFCLAGQATLATSQSEGGIALRGRRLPGIVGHKLDNGCPSNIPHRYPSNNRCFENVWSGRMCNVNPSNDPVAWQQQDAQCEYAACSSITRKQNCALPCVWAAFTCQDQRDGDMLPNGCPSNIANRYPGNNRCFENVWSGRMCNVDPIHDTLSFQQHDRPCTYGVELIEQPFRFVKLGSSEALTKIGNVFYPMGEQQAQQLDTVSNAVSIRRFNSRQVRGVLDFLSIPSFRSLNGMLFKSHMKYKATHPDDASPGQFWGEFEEVVAAQLLRKSGAKTKDIMTVHPLFELEETMDASAQRVKADFPIDFPTMQIKKWLAEKSLALDPNIMQHPKCKSGAEFINREVALGELVGWAVATVSPAAFATKWFIGRARPEEVAYSVSSNAADLDPPTGIKDMIDSMNMATSFDFTAYKDVGSPVHPSYPAMHSAASSLSTWIDVVGNLSQMQRSEARLLDYSIAYFRTLAGVHYESDNRAGLALGQLILQEKLPAHLAEKYSCDKATKLEIESYVRRKIETLKLDYPLDWATWVPEYWQPPVTAWQQQQTIVP